MLRSYDPQIGRFLQNDPYDQFSSGYVGMGNDPGNGVDPSGGFNVPSSLFTNATNAAVWANNVTVIGSLSKVGEIARKTEKLLQMKQAVSNFLWSLSGASAAVLDNFTGINLRDDLAPDPATNPIAALNFNHGLVNGDAGSIALAIMEGTTGESMMVGGAALALTGAGSGAAVPTVATGAALTAHSVVSFGRATYNIINGSGQVKFEPAPPPNNGTEKSMGEIIIIMLLIIELQN